MSNEVENKHEPELEVHINETAVQMEKIDTDNDTTLH